MLHSLYPNELLSLKRFPLALLLQSHSFSINYSDEKRVVSGRYIMIDHQEKYATLATRSLPVDYLFTAQFAIEHIFNKENKNKRDLIIVSITARKSANKQPTNYTLQSAHCFKK